MATGADWMSAASFIGMAGTLYLTGYGGLAFILGWTGGYCLVALLLAPYLRKFGQFTIPDFLGARYEGNLPRFIGIVAAILCSFTYVVAQIYGVGLITTRLSGLAFEIGDLRRPGRHPGVLLPRRHARGDLDAGGAVHHPDHCLPGAGDLAVGQADRRAGAPGDLRLPAREGLQARRRSCATTRRSSRWSRIFKAARGRVRCQAEGPARLAGHRTGCRREEARRPEGRQRARPPKSRRPRRRWPALPKDEADGAEGLDRGEGGQRGAGQAAGRHAEPRADLSPATRTAMRRRRRPSTNRGATSSR